MRSHDPPRVARVSPGPGDSQTLHVSLSTHVSLFGRGIRGSDVHKLQSWGEFLKLFCGIKLTDSVSKISTNVVGCLWRLISTQYSWKYSPGSATWHHCSFMLTFSPLLMFSHFQIVPMTLNPELQILTLQHNQISQIGSASFQFHPELLRVDLSNNGLKTVQVVEYYIHSILTFVLTVSGINLGS